MKRILLFLITAALLAAACGRETRCYVPIGLTNFSIDPNSAYYPGLNYVGGYMYLTGGHRGVVVVRTSFDSFVAYERTCPADSTSAVAISDEYGSALLECPECHSLFIVEADGYPMEGSATTCPLYQYGTTYSGGELWVY
jgi:hypothetical protein